MNRLFGVFLGISLLALHAGCGGRAHTPEGKVSGKVTLDGEPIKSGVVEFFSPDLGIGAIGMIDSDGAYTLNGPLTVGGYAVTIQPAVPEPGQPAPPPAKIPSKYATASTSGFTLQVAEGPNTIDLPLASK